MGALTKQREKAARDRYETLQDLSPLGLRYMTKKKSASSFFLGVLGAGNRKRTHSSTSQHSTGPTEETNFTDDNFHTPVADDDDGVCKKAYHFGTHYSCSAVVIHYLVRLQPFSSHSIALQAGRFDRPDRLFRSIRESWMSASGGVSDDPGTLTNNLQDVKELIPEFFFLPDFLCNINGYEMGFAAIRKELRSRSVSSVSCDDLARKNGSYDAGMNQDEEESQLGLRVGDVELPPWAHDSPKEFIRLHRAALESDYVSANLHHWIDLIFGFKQTGAPAEKACNLFHFLTYPGAVNVDKIASEDSKYAYEQQIRDFGQTPQQLFTSPHPMRRVRPANIIDTAEDASLKTTANLVSHTNGAKANSAKTLGANPSCRSDTTSASEEVTVNGSSDDPIIAAAAPPNEDPDASVLLQTPGIIGQRSQSMDSHDSHTSADNGDNNSTTSGLSAACGTGSSLTVVTTVSAPLAANQVQKLNISNLVLTGSATYVCVVTMSDIVLQSSGIRPLLTKNIPAFSNSMNAGPTKNLKTLLTNHRAVGSIQLNQATGSFEAAYNVSVISIPHLGSLASGATTEDVVALGYLEASLKVLSCSDGEWSVVSSFDCTNGSFSTQGSMSEDGEVLVICTYPASGIHIWRRSQTNYSVYLSMMEEEHLRAKSPSVESSLNSSASLNAPWDSFLSPTLHAVENNNAACDNIVNSKNRCKHFPYVLSETVTAYPFHYGLHTVITAVKVSTKFSIFVTACSTGVALLWDLESLRGMRLPLYEYFAYPNSGEEQQTRTSTPRFSRALRKDKVGCLDIDAVNGDVYVGIGDTVHIFDINGRLRIAVNVSSKVNDAEDSPRKIGMYAVGSESTDGAELPDAIMGAVSDKGTRVPSMNSVLCIQACPVVEWSSRRGFVVGCSNGSVMLWEFGFDEHAPFTKMGKGGRTFLSKRLKLDTRTDSENSTVSTVDAEVDSKPTEFCRHFSEECLVARRVIHIEEAFGSAAVTAVRISSDMRTIYAGSEEGTVSKWELGYKQETT
jgi:predicted amino acid-binding ACT domain protein